MKDQFTLARLEKAATHVFGLSESLGRPFNGPERRMLAWTLQAYDTPSIEAEFRKVTDPDVLARHEAIMERLCALLEPSPVGAVRLCRDRPGCTGEKHPKNHAPKLKPFLGVRKRDVDVLPTVADILQYTIAIEGLTTDLALVRGRNQKAAAGISTLAGRLTKAVRAFAEKCKAAPMPATRPSRAKIEKDARDLREWIGSG